jgi:hypothetical protein
MTSTDTAARAVVDVVTGTWRSQALYAAVELRLPDHVAEGNMTSADLAVRAHADPDSIIRLMRLLVGIDVFAGDDRSGYELTAMSQLLRTGVPGSMRDLCLMYGQEFHRAWGAVVPAITSGHSGFETAFGRTLHEFLADEPDAGPRFLRAMNAGSVFFDDVPKVFDFAACRTVVDLAGGSGLLLSTVLAANPMLHGILVDRDHMVPVAREQLGATLAPDRFEVRAGDMFESVPAGADVYVLSRILQDWEDSECITLLTNIRRAMADQSARLLIVERIIPTDGAAVLPLVWDLHLMMMAGGRERTMAGYESILDAANLRLVSVHDMALETSMLVVAPA